MAKQRNIGPEIIALGEKGYTYKQIMDELKCAKSTVSYYLGQEQKAKSRNRSGELAKRIDEWIREYKETHPCADCGRMYNYWQMGFDHLPGMVKSFGIANYKDHTRDINVVIKEVAKCEPVCHNCHSTRTHLRTNVDSTMHAVYPDEVD